MILSIIIPVYNGEKTIKKCIDSIRRIDSNDIEIIVVNDGSKDYTEKVLDNIACSEKRLIKYTIQNCGECGARNFGLDHSHGEYITFVDSDDWIDPNSYNEILNILKSKEKELIYADYYRVDNKRETLIKRRTVKKGENNQKELLDEVLKGCSNHVWGNFYSNRVIQENRLRFKNGVKVGGDAIFNIDYALCSQSVYYFSKAIYYYDSDNENSVMHKLNMHYLNDYILLFENYKRIVDTCPQLKIDVDGKYYLGQLFRCLYSGSKLKDELKIELKNSIFYSISMGREHRDINSLIKKLLIHIKLLGLF